MLWLLGAIAGGLAVWLTLVYGTPALTLAIVILIWSAVGVARTVKVAGTLVGAGGTLLTTLALAALRCASAPASGFDCRAPDVRGLAAFGVILLLSGATLTVRRVARADATPTSSP